MKLLYPCADSASDPLLWSGIVLNCRRALEEIGVEVAVMDEIPFECPPHLRVLHQCYKKFGRKTHLLQIEPAILRRAAQRIAARFAQGDCDAVFSPGTGVPVYALLPASIPTFAYLDATKASWIRTYFGLESLCARSRRHVDEIDRASLNHNAITFFASQWGVDQAMADYGIAPEKLAVVPFGANLVDPPSRSEVEAWISTRQRERFRFFFLGKEWERKGGPEALDLVRELRARGLKATIDIVGCTPQLTAADRALVELHGFIDHSRPEGRKKLRELLAGAHVLLFLSRAEAFGIAVCEAAAFGVPAFGANVGGIPTIVRPGENGWLASLPFSAAAAADVLAPALRAPEIYRQLALGARGDYETRLNWRAAATTIRDRIGKTLAGSRG
jgi:glycosyltransferase involved in cell wall biosynthesis